MATLCVLGLYGIQTGCATAPPREAPVPPVPAMPREVPISEPTAPPLMPVPGLRLVGPSADGTAKVSALAWASGAPRLAIARDGTLEVRDAGTAAVIATLTTPAAVTQLALSSDGARVAALGAAGTRWRAAVWDVGTKQELMHVEGALDPAHPPLLELAADGKLLAIGGVGAALYEVGKVKPRVQVPPESGWWLPVGNFDEAIRRVGDIAAQVAFRRPPLKAGGHGKAPTLDDAVMMPAFDERTVRFDDDTWAAVAGGELLIDGGMFPSVGTIAMPASSTLLAVALDGSVAIGDARLGVTVFAIGTLETALPPVVGVATAAAFRADGQVAVGAADGSVWLIQPAAIDENGAYGYPAPKVASLPPAYRDLFVKGRVLRFQGSVVLTGSESDSDTPIDGRCTVDDVKLQFGALAADLTCEGLDADYAFGPDGTWFANNDGLWRELTTGDGVIRTLRRHGPDVDATGGCLLTSDGQIHPETSVICFDATGLARLHFEGGPAAYQVDYTAKRVP